MSIITSAIRLLVSSLPNRYANAMREHIKQGVRRPGTTRKPQRKQTAETIARRLLENVVYDKRCRIGGTLSLNDLAETDIGDWMMGDFRAACAYAASQGWLIVQGDALTLTTAGLRAA